MSTPFDWSELDTIVADDADDRDRAGAVAALGDPWADMPDEPQSIEPLLAMYQRDLDNGMQDAPWPPVYPKMPGEPPRVAPSRAKKKKDA